MNRVFGVAELIACYQRGVFPMAESRAAGQLFLVDPEIRGVLPLEGFHVPRRLARIIRAQTYEITINRDFAGVLDGCAASTPQRRETWINASIRSLYLQLHQRGYAHSIETRQEGALIGGLYGVSLGAAFFGESMFSRARDASKYALVALAARLIHGGYRLLDTQFSTDHLAQFGGTEVPRAQFRRLLAEALESQGDYLKLPEASNGDQLLQEIAQTS